jgi:hypothetical protein
MTQTPASDAARCAEAIWAARQAGRTLDAEATIGTPDLATAHAIQRALLGLRLAAAERVVGWKLGYTSEVMRRQMGIDRPNIGPLTDRMLLGSGDAVHERLVQPRVEPEIGLRLKITLDARHARRPPHRGRRRGRRLRLPRSRALHLDRLPFQPRTEHRRQLVRRPGRDRATPARDRPDGARHRGGAPARQQPPHAGPGRGRRRPPAGRAGPAGAGAGCVRSAVGGW